MPRPVSATRDGETSKGWTSPSSNTFPGPYWIIRDGFLVGAPIGNRGVDLITAAAYGNFDLRFEWKISTGGNSGLKYFVGSSQKLVFEPNQLPFVEGAAPASPQAQFFETTSGFEYQLSQDREFPLSIQCHTGTVWIRSIKIRPLSPEGMRQP
ncbi:MAG: DUF1080 domain-containing protein [Bryobacterales bacterium]|nr:DUF1080 domain-containing protein [Bryobacterales bacterium]